MALRDDARGVLAELRVITQALHTVEAALTARQLRLEQLVAAVCAPTAPPTAKRDRRKPKVAHAVNADIYSAHAAPFVVKQTVPNRGVRYVVRINDRLLKVESTPQSVHHRTLVDAVAERDALVSDAKCSISIRGRYPKLALR